MDVQSASDHPGLPGRACVERWTRAAVEAGLPAPAALPCKEAEMSLRAVDIVEGAALNAAYRDMDGPTNVLSFPFAASEHTQPPLLGDVVVCVPVIEREASEQGKTMEAHFAHMVVHGVLHLLGYTHEAEEDAVAMEGAERRALAALGFSDPYAERGDGAP